MSVVWAYTFDGRTFCDGKDVMGKVGLLIGFNVAWLAFGLWGWLGDFRA